MNRHDRKKWNFRNFQEYLAPIAVMVIAAALRIPPVFSSLPYIDYIDEGYVLHQAITILNRKGLDPGWYGYPTLPAYLTVAATLVWKPVYRSVHGHSLSKDLPREQDLHTPDGDNYDLIEPPALIGAGRLVTALLGLATVAVTGLLARNFIDRRAGLLAMLLTALCPALVSRSANVIVDSFATFFSVVTFWCCTQINNYNRRKATVFTALAGFSAGLTFASKYTDVLVFGAVITAVALHGNSSLSRVRSAAVGIGTLAIGSFIGSPSAFFKFRGVWQELEQTAQNYSSISSARGYLGQAVESSELGWLLAVIGCIGIMLMLRRKETRSFAIGWFVFAGGLFAVFGFRSFQPFRNLLPLIPGLCVGASMAVYGATNVLVVWPPRLATRTVIGMTIGGLMLSLLVPSYIGIRERLTRCDTRIEAIDWMRDHIAADDRVLVLSELKFLSSEWNRVAAHVQTASLAAAVRMLRQEKFDYVISSRFETERGFRPPILAKYPEWQTLTNGMSVKAEFGQIRPPWQPYFWRTNYELILVLANEPAAP